MKLDPTLPTRALTAARGLFRREPAEPTADELERDAALDALVGRVDQARRGMLPSSQAFRRHIEAIRAEQPAPLGSAPEAPPRPGEIVLTPEQERGLERAAELVQADVEALRMSLQNRARLQTLHDYYLGDGEEPPLTVVVRRPAQPAADGTSGADDITKEN